MKEIVPCVPDIAIEPLSNVLVPDIVWLPVSVTAPRLAAVGNV